MAEVLTLPVLCYGFTLCSPSLTNCSSWPEMRSCQARSGIHSARTGVSCASAQPGRRVELSSTFHFAPLKRTEKVAARRILVKLGKNQGVRAATGGASYWVTVFQSVGIAMGTAGAAVIAGLLFRYKLQKEAEKDMEQLIEECKQNNRPLPETVEEFEEFKVRFQESLRAPSRKRPVKEE